MNEKAEIKSFFDSDAGALSSGSNTPASKFCSIIDSIMEIDDAAGRMACEIAGEIIEYIQQNDLN